MGHVMRILVVDDSRVMRKIIIRALRQAGYGGHDVAEAQDGVDAIRLVREGTIDLVLSDWNMPRMNGIELLAALRSEGHRVPFGFVTSEDCAQVRATAAAAGALFLLAKPFTPETVRDHLAPVLSGVPQPTAGAPEPDGDSESGAAASPGLGLPAPMDVKETFSKLLSRDVEVCLGHAVHPSDEPGALVGVYVDDTLSISTVASMDLPLAARSGAALGLLTPGAAEADVKDGELADAIGENAAEVLNVLASVLNAAGTDHQRLYSVYAPGEELPADVASWAVSLGNRLDITLDIKGYGTGDLSLVLAQLPDGS